MRSIPIVAKTRKLKAVWTPELAQDLNAYHSIDAEAELTSLLSEYVSMEIDLEILDMLRINASAKTENYGLQRSVLSLIQNNVLPRYLVTQMHTQKELGSKLLVTRYSQFLTLFIRRPYVVELTSSL